MQFHNKKAAIELSVGTIVVIVLAMTMLILGVVLVTNILRSGINIADVTDQQVRAQLVTLFTQEGSNIVVQTGANRVAEVESGGDTINVNLGARPQQARQIEKRSDLKYKLSYQPRSEASGNCDGLGVNVENFFKVSIEEADAEGSEISFDRTDGSTLYATIEITAPDGTPSCTQKIFISVYDDDTNEIQGSEFFTIRVKQGGIFS